jgi:hypothetical protein
MSDRYCYSRSSPTTLIPMVLIPPSRSPTSTDCPSPQWSWGASTDPLSAMGDRRRSLSVTAAQWGARPLPARDRVGHVPWGAKVRGVRPTLLRLLIQWEALQTPPPLEVSPVPPPIAPIPAPLPSSTPLPMVQPDVPSVISVLGDSLLDPLVPPAALPAPLPAPGIWGSNQR